MPGAAALVPLMGANRFGKIQWTTPGTYTWTVPSGVTSVAIDARGAQGFFSLGGLGGRVQATVAVAAGHVLSVHVGTTGAASWLVDSTTMTLLVVAGAGGSSGVVGVAAGVGGGLIGGAGGANGAAAGGGGGTQAAGGAGGAASGGTAGAAGTGPATAATPTAGGGGVGGAGHGIGGGGYYGGGGPGFVNPVTGSGGGGSSFTDPGATSVVHTQGFQTGNGFVKLAWT